MSDKGVRVILRPQPGKILKVLLIAIAVLSAAHLLSLSVWDSLEGKVGTHYLLRVFHLDYEANIPTYFSTVQLLVSSILLLLITVTHKSQDDAWVGWAGLSAAFCFLSFDEFIQIHELFTKPFQQLLGTSGVLSNAWVIPYGLAAACFAFFYLKFFLSLPKETKRGVSLAASCLVGGAVGLENFPKLLRQANVGRGIPELVHFLEEPMEMLGGAFFIYTWLVYIENQFGKFELVVGDYTHASSNKV